MRRTSIAMIALLTVVHATMSVACTTFCLDRDNRPVFGKNYDWSVGEGMVVINKRGMEKSAIGGNDNAFQWTSRYGSVTFNQYGRELPSGGINEAGLTIELMWLNETVYPQPDQRAALGNLQWIQYQLDQNATVEEIVQSDTEVRISRRSNARCHFLVADRTGDVATIEFLDGIMVVHRGANLPVRALTNSTYQSSIAHVEATSNAEPRELAGNGSLNRFARVARNIDGDDGSSAIDYAFDVLEDAAQGEHTRWSIVYDIAAGDVYFKTREAPRRKHIALGSIDFACHTPAVVIDLNDTLVEGDALPSMHPYDEDEAYALLLPAFRKVDFLRDVPEDAIRSLAQFCLSMECVGEPPDADASSEGLD